MYKTRSRTGKPVTLLNPAEKASKYADELRNGIRYTNDKRSKVNKKGVVMTVSKEGRAYRSEYLDARKDNANEYKANLKKKR